MHNRVHTELILSTKFPYSGHFLIQHSVWFDFRVSDETRNGIKWMATNEWMNEWKTHSVETKLSEPQANIVSKEWSDNEKIERESVLSWIWVEALCVNEKAWFKIYNYHY